MVVLLAVGVMLRGTGLLRLPLFGDEAIYLRWAQLVRGDGITGPPPPAHHWWISLADPKPPLHYWLIALVFRWADDPLAAARGLSVLFGLLSIPLTFLTAAQLAALSRQPSIRGIESRGILPTGPALGLMSALLVLFCPFIAFYQRLATADALFLTESIAVAWLSLRWARLAAAPSSLPPPSPPSRRPALAAWCSAAVLGVAIGIALLTRQGLSYTLCILPPLAWLLHRVAAPKAPPSGFPSLADAPPSYHSPERENPAPRPRLWIALMQLLAAAAVALAIWSPYLTAELGQRALDNRREATGDANPVLQREDVIQELKRRILYQQNFTDARTSRLKVAGRNLRWTFWPARNDAGTPESGWLYYYLTPAVYLAAMLGIPYLLLRRQWRIASFLFLWAFVMLGPPVLLGNVIYSRYVLAGVPPLLIAAAYLVIEAIGIMFVKLDRRPGFAWAGTILLMAVLILVPMRQLGLQATQWTRQTLTARDRYQYISGWPAGQATRKCLTYLMQLASVGPIVVITGNEWGTPADAMWVYLSRSPNVTLYYSDRPTVLTPGDRPGTYSLRRDKWLFPPYESVTLPPEVPVFYVCQNYLNGSPAADTLGKHNPNLGVQNSFDGIDDPEGGVSLFQMRTPPAPGQRP